MAEEERAQAIGSHVEGMEQLFRLQAERLDGIQRNFMEELEVAPPRLGVLFVSVYMVLPIERAG